MSINSGSGSIAEARIEKGLPFRIKGKMAIIGTIKDCRTFTLIWMKLQKQDLLKQDHQMEDKATPYIFQS